MFFATKFYLIKFQGGKFFSCDDRAIIIFDYPYNKIHTTINIFFPYFHFISKKDVVQNRWNSMYEVIIEVERELLKRTCS